MKQLLLLTVALIVGLCASAQIQSIERLWLQVEKGYFDSVLRAPVDTLRSSPSGSIAVINGTLYASNG
jgi:hypothetical protein